MKHKQVEPPLPTYTIDGDKYRPSVIATWLPVPWAWRAFLAGFVIMFSLIVTNVLVWQLVEANADKHAEQLKQTQIKNQRANCVVFSRSRQVLRGAIRGIFDPFEIPGDPGIEDPEVLELLRQIVDASLRPERRDQLSEIRASRDV